MKRPVSFKFMTVATIITGVVFVLLGAWILKSDNSQKIISAGTKILVKKVEKTGILLMPTETPAPTATPTIMPTPTPISFEEMDKNFGPCVRVSVLMYHHIQSEDEAKLKNQMSLTVTPDFFRQHLQYLKDKNYTIIEGKDLIDFFNGNKKLSGKLAMITLDDAYEDNYTQAYSTLKELDVKATIFTPTGLVNNLDYVTWEEMGQMRNKVYFGNHTWSHHSSAGTREQLEQEISWGDKQLEEKGFNQDKIFAYPYGSASEIAENILKEKNYALAFTTKYGNIMCKDKSLELPRIRVNNKSLESLGL